ncbi:MAG: DUF2786 domain-containing protein [Actinomycetota bacterium]
MENLDVERKIRALLERANHPGTPIAEAEAALAMAYRLMMKYDLDIRLLTTTGDDIARQVSDTVESRRYETVGPYRVRRQYLQFVIMDALSCAMYRDFEQGDLDTIVSYGFGTAHDLDAAETLYTAAELLAQRTLPWGDRGYRTAWWRGFTDGLRQKLRRERRKVERSTTGAALVLRERGERAEEEMVRFCPTLVWRSTQYSDVSDAYGDGHRAGSRFETGERSVHGGSLSLPPGA